MRFHRYVAEENAIFPITGIFFYKNLTGFYKIKGRV